MSDPHAAPVPGAPAALSEPPPRRARLRALGGFLLLVVMLGGVWALGYWEPRLLPVRTVEVQGELHHHSSEQLHETLVSRLDGGFLTANLKELKAAAEGLPWVGAASIRRVWPDRLQVRVEEHRPVARWKDDGLVTAEGVVFHPRGPIPAGLPVLSGDESRSRELVGRYLKWRDSLMLAGQLIDTLTVDPRGAWHLDLVSALRVELGTDEIEHRLDRFIAAVPQLEAAGRARVVDLRYRNGFAVRWAGSGSEVAAEPAPAPAAGVKPAAQKRSKAPAKPKRQVQTPGAGKRAVRTSAMAAISPAAKPGTGRAREATRPGAAPAKAREQPPASRGLAPGEARGGGRALTQAAPARH